MLWRGGYLLTVGLNAYVIGGNSGILGLQMRDHRLQDDGIVHCRQAIAKQAKRLPDGSGWLPKPLRQDDTDFGPQAVAEDARIELPAFLTDDDEGQPDYEVERQHLIAAK